MAKKLPNGRWQGDVRLGRKRYRKNFKTKAEAVRWESWMVAQAAAGQPWNPELPDNRTLSELVELWHEHHGCHLSDKRRTNKLRALAKRLGNPIASKVEPSDFSAYRTQRLKEGVSAKTLNNELGYLNALYNRLHKLKLIGYPSPLQHLEPIPIQEKPLHFLDKDEIDRLLDEVDRTGSEAMRLVVRICLATGARWNEVTGLTAEQIGRDRVTYVNTKSKKRRTVGLAPELCEAARAHLKEHGPLKASEDTFTRIMERAGVRKAKGQATHILRHTFASWFVINGGNILALKELLGHADIKMTMRYAHLAPDYGQAAIELNPLTVVRNGQKPTPNA